MCSSILCLINFFILLNVIFGRPEKDDLVELRILGGDFAADKQFPYIGYFTQMVHGVFAEVFCGGSIIHRDWVLTAGHCCRELDNQIISFVAGTLDTNQENKGQKRRVVKFFIHENMYDKVVIGVTSENNKSSYVNMFDIGVTKLDSSLEFNNYVQPILLNRDPNTNFIGKNVTFMGWGSNGKYQSTSLMYAEGKIIDLEECRNRLENIMKVEENHHVCTVIFTDDKSEISTCKGDSGGPLVVNGIQIAVTTDVNCNDSDSVFVDVAMFFGWIREKLALCGYEIFDEYGESVPKDYLVNKPKSDMQECNRPTTCTKAKTTIG